MNKLGKSPEGIRMGKVSETSQVSEAKNILELDMIVQWLEASRTRTRLANRDSNHGDDSYLRHIKVTDCFF